jgi:hypothetical protein
MNAVFKLIFFSVMVNFAVGLLITLVPTFNGYDAYQQQYGKYSYLSGLSYNETVAQDFYNETNNPLDPTFGVQSSSTIFDRVLDKIGLGFIGQFKRLVDKYMFGIVNLLEGFTSRFFVDANAIKLQEFLFGGNLVHFGLFRGIITVGYVLGVIYLFTGKKILSE